jgi:hypothetical protein
MSGVKGSFRANGATRFAIWPRGAGGIRLRVRRWKGEGYGQRL